MGGVRVPWGVLGFRPPPGCRLRVVHRGGRNVPTVCCDGCGLKGRCSLTGIVAPCHEVVKGLVVTGASGAVVGSRLRRCKDRVFFPAGTVFLGGPCASTGVVPRYRWG